ncbi:MAG: leucyl/phenylalanyl-tRNA--protein transferase [Pseudomonadota bacterium]
MIPWLIDDATPFPPVEKALHEPNGLLAASDSLTVTRLKKAYSLGIFPWYSPGEPVLWWSPSPRMVLYTHHFKCHRSLRQIIKKKPFEIRLDTAFETVMKHCAQAQRPRQHGTWIVQDIIQAYTALHQQGLAHSVEAWEDDSLVGGLYGVNIGQMFFGESMFSLRPNASKIALAHLVDRLSSHGLNLIDCQQETSHLASLGASPISRDLFKQEIHTRIALETPKTLWL